MNKYKYRDNKDIVSGNVVEFIIPNYSNQFTRGKLYIVSDVQICHVIENTGRSNGFGNWNNFKLIHTAPGSEVTTGDDYIVVTGEDAGKVFTDGHVTASGTVVSSTSKTMAHNKRSILKLVKPTNKTRFIYCKIRVTLETRKAIDIKLREYDLVGERGYIGGQSFEDEKIHSYYINSDSTDFMNNNNEDSEPYFENKNYTEIYWVDGDFSFEKPETSVPSTNQNLAWAPEPLPAGTYEVPLPTPDCIAKSFASTSTPILKKNKMETPITVAMTAKEYAKYQKSENTPVNPKTLLQLAKKHLTQWYDSDGLKINEPITQTAKQAERELQSPNRIGWTYRTYTLSASGTTDIPTKSLV